MFSITPSLLVLAATAALSPPPDQPAAAPTTKVAAPVPASTGLTVHEWGTFTNFQGSDGRQFHFHIPIGEGLPDFVLGPDGQHPCRAGDWVKESFYALNRMETPVIYFYSDQPETVSVKVNFTQGIISEIYPPATFLGSGGKVGEISPGMELRWEKVQIMPRDTKDAEPPPISGVTHYGAARETDSALLRVRTGNTDHFEKFLFYRGLGDFDIPVHLKALGNDRFELSNSCAVPTGDIYVVEIDGSRTRYSKFAGGVGTQPLTLGKDFSDTDKLSADVKQSLVKAGLFEKEAAAMVKTWRSLWFAEQGTRVLYILPEAPVGTMLPLRIEPAPAKLQRVFVGRMDVLTPERERDLIHALANRANKQPDTLDQQLRTLGRFSAPALWRMTKAAYENKPAIRQLKEMGYAGEP